MIAKIDLEKFKAKIDNYRTINIVKVNNAMTKGDEQYYTARGIGFEQAISIFLECAEYEIDDKDEVQE